MDSRFLVGIDLGTTNIAVSYVDRLSEEPTELRSFPVSQYVAAGEMHERNSLPSFLYILPEHEKLALPWDDEPDFSVGTYARNHGSSVVSRFVSSAKSWLAHRGVDRLAKILPWGSELATEEKLSPVAVSQQYLAHIREAWNQKMGTKKDAEGSPCFLEEQQIVLTVPASFDEVARELTVQAAHDAGFKKLTLLEEPLSAFYSYLAHEDNWEEKLNEGDKILIVDIGGGTSDFSLVEFEKGGQLRRTAVGRHLLLGGDNIDMALARHIERQWKKSLPARDWALLVQQCRKAKEDILAHKATEVSIAVSSAGSSLIANTLSASIDRQMVDQVVFEGFYPLVAVDSADAKSKSGLRDLGLPYENDPAVTRHLLSFLRQASQGEGLVVPDKLLFNGGSMIPDALRRRILEQVRQWDIDKEVLELESKNLDLAVSLGASYYALVKSGEGVRVQGGIARSYFVEVAGAESSRLLCVMPRDTEEGVLQSLDSAGSTEFDLDKTTFKVQCNQPVQFPVYSSATRLGDQLGDWLDEPENLTALPALKTVIQYGKKDQVIEVKLEAMLNEVGTLDLYLKSIETDHRWRLQFDVRSMHEESQEEIVLDIEEVAVTDEQFAAAQEALSVALNDKNKIAGIAKTLEKCFDLKKEEWSLSLIRRLADELIALQDLRQKSAQNEARWLNLMGFCLRPGFGDGMDAWRVKKVWANYFEGPKFKNDAQVQAEWWVTWRRISGGLKRGHHEQMGHVLMKALMPKGNYKTNTRNGLQEKREMWRCLGSLELLSLDMKSKILDLLVSRGTNGEDFELWSLARLGARELFHGPLDLTLPAAKAEVYVKTLLDERTTEKKKASYSFALLTLASYIGDKSLDLSEELREKVKTRLTEEGLAEDQLRHLFELKEKDSKERKQQLGDSLPIGLSL